jgi:hypothetical protein
MGIFNKKHLCCLDHLLFLVYGELNEKTACVLMVRAGLPVDVLLVLLLQVCTILKRSKWQSEFMGLNMDIGSMFSWFNVNIAMRLISFWGPTACHDAILTNYEYCYSGIKSVRS